MDPEELKYRIASGEFKFTTSRSSGPGGQNVNKVSTKVELRFNVPASSSFTGYEKERILLKLKNRITSDGDLIVVSQSGRTQLENRKRAEDKFFRMIADALTEKPKRKKTKATLASKVRRIEKKRRRSEIKNLRKNRGINEDHQ
jgi:ribosome-associated protein